jgi:long-chain acyl-CoA synthetase
MTTAHYRNLVDLHRRQAERFGPRPALRLKRDGLYHDLSWQDYRAAALACAAALVDAGVRPGDRVGLLSENRAEWLVADMGILTAAAVNVPPHAPLTPRQVAYQLGDAGASWLFVSSRPQLDKVREVRGGLPALRGVVVFDRGAAAEALPWSGFLQRGRALLPRLAGELARREEALGPDDLATIMYTSGTTADPKGVMLTHGNLLSNALATMAVSECRPDEVLLSWLPYSHIYARTCDHYMSLASGTVVCLAESPETLLTNLAEVRPSRMTSVPRFYEKVHAALAGPDPEETGRRLRSAFGPRIDFLCSGGAPLSPAVARAYHAAGLLVLQGYGLTESSPVISFNRKSRYKLETVGPPIPGVEVRVAEDGEVLTRGPHVMKGYWNNPQATAEALRDGWLHTGDLGALDDGFLSITGRKKELLVLSNGKKVVPSAVEGRLLAEPCIDQAVVYGEGHNFLTALVVPNWPNLRRALAEAGTSPDGQADEALATHPAAVGLLERRVAAAVADLSRWERPKKFVVLPRPFSVAADELTVSLKLRRGVIFAHHREALEALYRD